MTSKIYQEHNSTFGHNDKTYDLNKIFKIVHNKPIKRFNINDLKWMLKYAQNTKENELRIKRADLKYPIIITKIKNKLAIVDGMHRLQKIIKLWEQRKKEAIKKRKRYIGLRGVTINGYLITKKELDSALIHTRSSYRKNPAFYKVGYHATTERNFQEILNSKKLTGSKSKWIYNDLKPLYFLTYNKPEFLTQEMVEFFKIKNVLIKIDVSEYNQYPDFGSLKDLGFDIASKFGSDGWLYHGSKLTYIESLLKIPKPMQKWIKKFNNHIPLDEFFTNPQLIQDAIATSHTFVILQDIPITKILDILIKK